MWGSLAAFLSYCASPSMCFISEREGGSGREGGSERGGGSGLARTGQQRNNQHCLLWLGRYVQWPKMAPAMRIMERVGHHTLDQEVLGLITGRPTLLGVVSTPVLAGA